MMRWDEILMRLPTDRPVVGVEVGVYRGENAFVLLDHRPLLTLCLVDTWKPYKGGADGRGTEADMRYARMRVMTMAGFYGRRAPIVNVASSAARKEFPDASVDFVFVDAQHAYRAVKADIEAWRGAVKPGGWIGGHDYGSVRFPGVKKAVDEVFGGAVETGEDLTWFAWPNHELTGGGIAAKGEGR